MEKTQPTQEGLIEVDNPPECAEKGDEGKRLEGGEGEGRLEEGEKAPQQQYIIIRTDGFINHQQTSKEGHVNPPSISFTEAEKESGEEEGDEEVAEISALSLHPHHHHQSAPKASDIVFTVKASESGQSKAQTVTITSPNLKVVGGGEDEEKSNSTISTLETSAVGMDLDFSGKSPGFVEAGELDLRGSVLEDFSGIQGDVATLDWLNNQVAVAISNGVLPVTCKQIRGELFLDRFGSGNRGKCIKAYGLCFTPTEFEAYAGRAQCKDWKRSIRFHGRPLLQLIELDVLKVHAVSCTCTACWNGESTGPVRLHDVKRKTSSFGTVANPKRAMQTIMSTDGTPGLVDEPLLKHIRLEVQKEAEKRALEGTVKPTPTVSVNGGSATLVRGQDGSYRLVTQGQTPSTSGVVSGGSGGGGGGQRVAFIIPQHSSSPANKETAQITPNRKPAVYVPVGPYRGGMKMKSTATTSAMSLPLTYTPVQLVSGQEAKVVEPATTPSTSNTQVTIYSAELTEHWSYLEEIVNNLQAQVTSLRGLVAQSKQKTEKALHDVYAQTSAINANEIAKLRASVRMHASRTSSSTDNEPETKLCANCNRPATIACASCQQTFYCGDFCVQKDGPTHKERCSGLRNVIMETVNID